MSFRPHHLQVLTSTLTCLLAVVVSLVATAVQARGQSPDPPTPNQIALELIYRQKYNDAITRLEAILETEPGNHEALTYMATANLYQTRDFLNAQKEFEQAFKAGGGATFVVNHSHEMFSTGHIVDYCRGWLHLRRNTVEFVPLDSNHGFKVQFDQLKEFKRNRLSKKVFHIKFDEQSRNFRGRTNTELEPLLIVALYQNFKRN